MPGVRLALGSQRASMKRLSTILVFLLFGAVFNVAVAWGCAIYVNVDDMPVQKLLIYNLPRPALPSETRIFWILVENNSFGSTHLWGLGFVETDQTKAKTEHIPHIPAWSLFSDPPTTRMTLTEKSKGWPFRTLYWVQTRYRGKRFSTNQHVWIVQKQPWNAWIIPNTPGNAIYLPLAPIWSGLLLNTFFYAAILWLFIPGPFVLRRAIRRRRGLCVKCSYDLRGADHEACPECGEEIRKGNPA